MADLRTDEPILIRSSALAIVHAVSLFLVAHGVFTADQASSLVQFVVPMVAAVLTMLVGVLMRQQVRPVAKDPQPEADKPKAAAKSAPAHAAPPSPPAAPVASAQ